MKKIQLFKRSLLSSAITSPVIALMITLGFDGSRKNGLVILLFILISVLTFSASCVFAYPVGQWEERVFKNSSYGRGAFTWAAHSIIFYPVSIYLIKIPYSYIDKITTDNTFGLLFIHSLMSAFVLFIISLTLEGLKE